MSSPTDLLEISNPTGCLAIPLHHTILTFACDNALCPNTSTSWRIPVPFHRYVDWYLPCNISFFPVCTRCKQRVNIVSGLASPNEGELGGKEKVWECWACGKETDVYTRSDEDLEGAGETMVQQCWGCGYWRDGACVVKWRVRWILRKT